LALVEPQKEHFCLAKMSHSLLTRQKCEAVCTNWLHRKGGTEEKRGGAFPHLFFRSLLKDHLFFSLGGLRLILDIAFRTNLRTSSSFQAQHPAGPGAMGNNKKNDTKHTKRQNPCFCGVYAYSAGGDTRSGMGSRHPR
jgi:hypothetical protein